MLETVLSHLKAYRNKNIIIMHCIELTFDWLLYSFPETKGIICIKLEFNSQLTNQNAWLVSSLPHRTTVIKQKFIENHLLIYVVKLIMVDHIFFTLGLKSIIFILTDVILFL